MEGRTEIRVLKELEEKAAAIELYRQAFQDTEAFISLYYQEKCRDNRIVVTEKAGKVISMVHLNPYTMMVHEIPHKVYYIVAVATDRESRGQGHMRETMRYALQWMQGEKIPFCYLMPIHVRLYESLGFEVICEFDKNQDRDMGQIRGHYDMYCLRDEDYLSFRAAERRLLGKGMDSGQTHPPIPALIMARIVDRAAFARMSGLGADTPQEQMMQWLKEKRIYICEEV